MQDDPIPLSEIGRIARLGPKVEVFGDYYLLERVGIGGMAEVHRARRFRLPTVDGKSFLKANHEPLVVLKRLLPEAAANPDFADNFVIETDIARLLDHPHIVQTLDSGEVDGAFFLVMEYVSGVNLNTLLGRLAARRQEMPQALAMHLVCCVLDGLIYAHNMQLPSGRKISVIHRDVSPHNVFLDFNGRVKLGDFGVVHIDEMAGDSAGVIVTGKLGYLSPEQVVGESLDERTDLFSLSTILWECVTGRRLFYANPGEQDMDVMKRIRRGSIPDPRQFVESLNEGLAEAILTGLRQDREERFHDAKTMQNALKPFSPWSVDQGSKALAKLMAELFEAEHALFVQDQQHGLLPKV